MILAAKRAAAGIMWSVSDATFWRPCGSGGGSAGWRGASSRYPSHDGGDPRRRPVRRASDRAHGIRRHCAVPRPVLRPESRRSPAPGTPYETEEDYFRDVLAVASWRTAYRRLAVGRMLSAFDEPERSALRTAIAEVGLAKAATLVPAIERTGTWPIWVDLARQLSAPVLQERVSAALQAAPRGREVSPPGERFRRAVLSAMPDIEAMELVERFFEVGATMAGTPHPVAIFLAGCRECLAEWEPQVARRPRVPGQQDDTDDRRHERCDERDEGDERGDRPPAAVCQQWQTKAGP